MINEIGTKTEQNTWKLTLAEGESSIVHDGLSRVEARVAIEAMVRGAAVPSPATQIDADRHSEPIAIAA